MKRFFRLVQTLFGLLTILLLLVTLLGPATAVELSNAVAPGEVVAKQETVRVRRSGWSRQLLLDVRYTPAGSSSTEQASIRVDPDRFDLTEVGASVEVRYGPWPQLRQLGNIAAPRLQTQGPYGQLVAALGEFRWLVLGVGLWCVLLAIWSVWRMQWLLVVLATTMLGGALVVAFDLPPAAPVEPRLQATAIVEDVHEVNRLWRGRQRTSPDLPQPYLIVELRYTPAGTNDPVLAVDQIDQGAVISKGASLPIIYNNANPRQAQIVAAQRSYYWKNLMFFVPFVLLVIALLVGGMLFRVRPQGSAR
jgi:hypothetical protein